jgi:hypothetical protein
VVAPLRSLLHQLACVRSRHDHRLLCRQVSHPSLAFCLHCNRSANLTVSFYLIPASSLRRWSPSSRLTRPTQSLPRLRPSSLLTMSPTPSTSRPTSRHVPRSTSTSPTSSSSLSEEPALSLSRPTMSSRLEVSRLYTTSHTTSRSFPLLTSWSRLRSGSVLLVYNNVAGSFTADFGKADIVGAAISMEDGESVVAAYNADKTLTITFPSDYYNLPNTLTPGLVSVRNFYLSLSSLLPFTDLQIFVFRLQDFTSYGPTFDQYFKPCKPSRLTGPFAVRVLMRNALAFPISRRRSRWQHPFHLACRPRILHRHLRNVHGREWIRCVITLPEPRS